MPKSELDRIMAMVSRYGDLCAQLTLAMAAADADRASRTDRDIDDQFRILRATIKALLPPGGTA